MRIKCDSCGARIRDDETVCPKCGYRIYSSEFADIAREVENKMNNISQYELNNVAAEMKHNENKLTLEEFEIIYQKMNRTTKPLPLARNILKIVQYESDLKKAYKNYLESLGYE